MTTVGYGDIAPQTVLGQTLASFIMILGYGIIAVPTGIVTSKMQTTQQQVSGQACPSCSREGHSADAKFCKYCGEKMWFRSLNELSLEIQLEAFEALKVKVEVFEPTADGFAVTESGIFQSINASRTITSP